MASQCFLGAYWGARPETIEGAAERMRTFFAGLADADPNMRDWFERGGSRGAALKKPAAVRDRDYLLSKLAKGRNRRDDNNEVIEDLGFRLGLWSPAAAGEDTSIDIACGIHFVSRSGGTPIKNRVVLDLPQSMIEPDKWESWKRC